MTRLDKIILFCLSFLLVTSLPLRAQDIGGVQSDQATRRLILSISDVHFDPLNTTDKTVPAKLIKHHHDDWEHIYSVSSDKHLSHYGQDTNFNLLKSTLVKMRSICKKPDFILFSGDLLGHKFASYRHKYFKHNEADFDKFILRTLRFIDSEFAKYFPDIPVIFTLGNNDSYSDYGIAPNGSFLNDSNEIFFSYIRQPSSKKTAFNSTFIHGGNYTVLPTEVKTNRIISINNIFFSRKNDYKEQGWAQLEWLQSELDSARANNENVWLLFHIPPGVDVGGSVSTAGKKSSHIAHYWDTSVIHSSQTFLDRFYDITRKYSSNIKAICAGHTHMDHFRLIFDDSNNPISYAHITPSVSPIFKNNPAFQVMTYDSQTFSILNVETWYYRQTAWKKEYDFDRTYKISSFTPSTLNTASIGIKDESATRKFFINYYDVNNPNSLQITKTNWKAYWCGIGALQDADFNACYK